MKDIIKVGIIGCGAIAWEKHMPSLTRIAGIEIVAFQDLNIERAKDAKEKYGSSNAKVFADYEELLKEDIDVVHVCTPNNTHAPISIAAMRAGKHVMCEKPMATTVEDAEELVKVSKETGKKLSISLQNRYRKDTIHLKRMIEKDELGEIYFAKAHAIRRRGVPVWGKFLDKEYQGGGPLIDIGVHALDLTLWLMDNYKPKYVVGNAYTKLGNQEGLFNTFGEWNPEKFEVEDSAFGFIVMEDGATVILESSWALNILQTGEAKSTLCGTKGGADMQEGLRINGDKDGSLYTMIPNIDSKTIEYYNDENDNVFFVEAESWIGCIKKDEEPIVKPEEVLIVTKIIDALYKSSESKKPIYFE